MTSRIEWAFDMLIKQCANHVTMTSVYSMGFCGACSLQRDIVYENVLFSDA